MGVYIITYKNKNYEFSWKSGVAKWLEVFLLGKGVI